MFPPLESNQASSSTTRATRSTARGASRRTWPRWADTGPPASGKVRRRELSLVSFPFFFLPSRVYPLSLSRLGKTSPHIFPPCSFPFRPPPTTTASRLYRPARPGLDRLCCDPHVARQLEHDRPRVPARLDRLAHQGVAQAGQAAAARGVWKAVQRRRGQGALLRRRLLGARDVARQRRQLPRRALLALGRRRRQRRDDGADGRCDVEHDHAHHQEHQQPVAGEEGGGVRGQGERGHRRGGA